jgi:hypothetical protein
VLYDMQLVSAPEMQVAAPAAAQPVPAMAEAAGGGGGGGPGIDEDLQVREGVSRVLQRVVGAGSSCSYRLNFVMSTSERLGNETSKEFADLCERLDRIEVDL